MYRLEFIFFAFACCMSISWQDSSDPGEIVKACRFRSGVNLVYEIDRSDTGLLGKGAFSTVRIAQHRRSGLFFAVKIVQLSNLDAKTLARVYREIIVLRSLDHPRIVKIYDVFQEDGVLYMILELCSGGELFQFMVQVETSSSGQKFCRNLNGERMLLSENRIASVIRSIVEALNYCHSRNVCHRDLKLENLMLVDVGEELHVKLIDFGFCKVFNSSDSLRAAVGSPYYVAPDVLIASEPTSPGYGAACDLWSCGVIAYMMLCGQAPFDGADDKQRCQAVATGAHRPFPEHVEISREAKQLVTRMLEPDPFFRITAAEVAYISDCFDQPLTLLKLSYAKLHTRASFTFTPPSCASRGHPCTVAEQIIFYM